MTDAQVFTEQSWCWRDAQTKCTWVFGMRWLPSLGQKGKRHLYRNLRQQGMGWAVTHGRTLSLVGVQTQQTPTKPQRPMASAAVAFAMAHPQGVHALCLQVAGVGIWFVASSQGCVLSETDRWFQTLEEAQLALQPLRERHDPMCYEELVWSPEAVGSLAQTDAESAPTTAPPFLRAQVIKACQFRKLPSGQSAWPLVMALACLGLATMWVVHRLWMSPEVPDSRAAFEPSPAAMALQVNVHHNNRLRDLFDAWTSLPVDPSGWVLQRVRCRVKGESVHCHADYQRQRPDADNVGLTSHMPRHWQFQPKSLDLATFERRLLLPVQSRDAAALLAYDSGLTRLQRLSAKFAAVSVGSPQQINAVSSLSQSNHTTGDTAVRRAVSIRLALRQAAVLEQFHLPMRWQQIDLSVVQGAQIDQQHGYLMVTLKGDWLVGLAHRDKAGSHAVMPDHDAQTKTEPQPNQMHTPQANINGEFHEID